MANLTRCSKQHFYDSEKYRTCPYCAQTQESQTPTESMHSSPDPLFSRTNIPTDDLAKTIGYYDSMRNEPVIGWLIAIDGAAIGKDYRLHTGRNYIGRDANMDVVLESDNAVSRNKHAIIIFDPVSQTTLCQSGESRELFYLNGKVVTDTVKLNKGDILTVGKTKLMFVPFCGELHSWENQE